MKKQLPKLYKTEWQRTLILFLRKMYLGQIHRSINRGHKLPNYTINEFFVRFIKDKKFIRTYKNWVTSNYKHDLVPSFDRINSSKPYTFDNVRLLTWQQNRKNHAVERSRSLQKSKGRKKITRLQK